MARQQMTSVEVPGFQPIGQQSCLGFPYEVHVATGAEGVHILLSEQGVRAAHEQSPFIPLLAKLGQCAVERDIAGEYRMDSALESLGLADNVTGFSFGEAAVRGTTDPHNPYVVKGYHRPGALQQFIGMGVIHRALQANHDPAASVRLIAPAQLATLTTPSGAGVIVMDYVRSGTPFIEVLGHKTTRKPEETDEALLKLLSEVNQKLANALGPLSWLANDMPWGKNVMVIDRPNASLAAPYDVTCAILDQPATHSLRKLGELANLSSAGQAAKPIRP